MLILTTLRRKGIARKAQKIALSQGEQDSQEALLPETPTVSVPL